MAYVPAASLAPDAELEIDVRGPARARAHRAAAVLQATEEYDMYPADLKYTKDHEWIRVTGDQGRVGITDYAQKQLGDVVYVELPEVGRTVTQGEVVRHDRVGKGGVGALRAGVGRDRRSQRDAQGYPETINSDPHGAWMVRSGWPILPKRRRSSTARYADVVK